MDPIPFVGMEGPIFFQQPPYPFIYRQVTKDIKVVWDKSDLSMDGPTQGIHFTRGGKCHVFIAQNNAKIKIHQGKQTNLKGVLRVDQDFEKGFS